jgi:hypothetical protein
VQCCSVFLLYRINDGTRRGMIARFLYRFCHQVVFSFSRSLFVLYRFLCSHEIVNEFFCKMGKMAAVARIHCARVVQLIALPMPILA